MNTELKGGLRLLEKDNRDFTVGALFRLPDISELPSDFSLTGYEIKNQKNTDMCSAFATTGASELQEKIRLSPEYSFAMGKKLSGDIDDWGQDLRTACKVHQSIGDIEQIDAPYSVETNDSSFLRNPNNWDISLSQKAEKHKKQTYLRVTSDGADSFDTIRQTIWKWKDENRAVIIGLQFSWKLEDIILETKNTGGFGHAMYIIGWKTINNKQYLIAVNSYGKEAGDNGTHLISREIINFFEPLYGSFMFIDKPSDEISYYFENKIKAEDSWIAQFLKITWTIITSAWLTAKEKTDTIHEATTIMNTIADKIEPKMENMKYDWSSPANVRHSIRVIGDEMNAGVFIKDLACDICKCESNFDPNAKLINNDLHKSIDRGLFQWNNYWHPEITDEMAYNPEIATRLFYKTIKNEGAKAWHWSAKCWNKDGKYNILLK